MFRFRSSRRRRRQRGAAAVEFALIFLVLLLLTFGLLEGALAVWTYNTLSHAVRQGARFASVHGSGSPTTSAAITDVIKQHAIGLNGTNLSVTTTWAPDNRRGSAVQVQASYNHPLVFGSMIFPNGSLTLRSTSRMTIYN